MNLAAKGVLSRATIKALIFLLAVIAAFFFQAITILLSEAVMKFFHIGPHYVPAILEARVDVMSATIVLAALVLWVAPKGLSVQKRVNAFLYGAGIACIPIVLQNDILALR
jgi:hypothetical protein